MKHHRDRGGIDRRVRLFVNEFVLSLFTTAVHVSGKTWSGCESIVAKIVPSNRIIPLLV